MDFSLPPEFALDTETNGLDWYIHRPFGFSVFHPETGGRYYDIRKFPRAKAWLEEQIFRAKIIYSHHAKFDMHMLREAGVKFDSSKFRCSMVRAALINEHEHEYNLDYLAKKHCGIAKIEMSKEEKSIMADLPSSRVSPYAIRDAEAHWLLAKWQEPQLEAQGLMQLDALECRILQINLDAEKQGIRVDIDRAYAAIPALDIEFDKTMDKIRQLAGCDLNINSPVQIRNVFAAEKDENGTWRTADGTRLNETDAGSPSFNKDALKIMKNPLGPLIVQAREIGRLGGTFLKQHVIAHAREHSDGTWRVHPNINQTKGETGFGTVTGRMSYDDPAMQQIPNRNEASASIMRPIFLPFLGQEWGYGDLDQHEFRVFAHYTRNPRLEQIYRDNPNTDFHQIVADLTGLPRSAKASGQANAKQLNLGLVFNMGAGLMAQQMGLPYTPAHFFKGRNGDGSPKRFDYLKAGKETMEILARYHQEIPGVKEMADQASSIAAQRGYVKTITGRRIRFPDPSFSYKASGLVYQGTSADLNKMNIVTCHDVLKGSDSKYVMNVHDEYSLSLAPGDDHLVKEIQSQIQGRGLLRIPIRIDFAAGKNWWDAAKNGRKLT